MCYPKILLRAWFLILSHAASYEFGKRPKSREDGDVKMVKNLFNITRRSTTIDPLQEIMEIIRSIKIMDVTEFLPIGYQPENVITEEPEIPIKNWPIR